jgi:hypothetical protein
MPSIIPEGKIRAKHEELPKLPLKIDSIAQFDADGERRRARRLALTSFFV